MVDEFVGKVNSAVRRQEEVEKVKSVLHRLTTTSVVHDIPSGWEKVFKRCLQVSYFIIVLQCLQPYMRLDLLAPMSGVDEQQLRTLITEGALRYKEDTVKVSLMIIVLTIGSKVLTQMT